MIDLLQASALLVFAATIGFGHALCLQRRPGRLSSVAIATILERTRGFAIGWAILAVAWCVFARHGAGAREIPELLAMLLAAAAVAVQLWTHTHLAAEVQEAAERAEDELAGGAVAHIDEEGYWRVLSRESDPRFGAASARTGVALWTGILIPALLLFGVSALSLVMDELASPLSIAATLAFWIAFGTIAMDLCLDVWPGTATPERVRSCAIYYIHIFEHWINVAVLAGLFGTAIMGPLLWWRGEASVEVLAFALFLGACLLFATAVNEGLVRAGFIERRLPLPMARNAYAAERPTWAIFLATIHVGMAIGLAVGLLALYRAH